MIHDFAIPSVIQNSWYCWRMGTSMWYRSSCLRAPWHTQHHSEHIAKGLVHSDLFWNSWLASLYNWVTLYCYYCRVQFSHWIPDIFCIYKKFRFLIKFKHTFDIEYDFTILNHFESFFALQKFLACLANNSLFCATGITCAFLLLAGTVAQLLKSYRRVQISLQQLL